MGRFGRGGGPYSPRARRIHTRGAKEGGQANPGRATASPRRSDSGDAGRAGAEAKRSRDEARARPARETGRRRRAERGESPRRRQQAVRAIASRRTAERERGHNRLLARAAARLRAGARAGVRGGKGLIFLSSRTPTGGRAGHRLVTHGKRQGSRFARRHAVRYRFA